MGNIVFWENTEPWLTVLYWPLPFCGQYCVLGEHWALTYSVILTSPLLWAILCSGRTLSLDLQCYTDLSPSVGNIVFWENTEPRLTVLYWPLPFCGQYCVLGEHWALTYSVILTPPLLWAILCSLDLQCYADPSVGNIVFWENAEPWLQCYTDPSPSVGNIVFPWLTVLYWRLPFCGQYCVLGEHWALTYSVILTSPLLWAILCSGRTLSLDLQCYTDPSPSVGNILCSGRTLSLDLQCYTDPSPSVGNIVFWGNTEPWLTVLYWPLPFCGQYCVLGEHWALTYSVILTPPLLWAILCSGGTLILILTPPLLWAIYWPLPFWGQYCVLYWVNTIVFWENTEPWLTVLYWPLPFLGQYCVLGEHWALTYSVILTPPLMWAILCSGRTLSLDLQCYTDPSPSVGNIVFWENTEPWLTVLYWPLPFCGQYCVLGEHWALTYSVILTPPLLWAILCSGRTLSLDLQCYTDPSPSVGNIVFWENTEPWLTVLYWPLPFCGQYCVLGEHWALTYSVILTPPLLWAILCSGGTLSLDLQCYTDPSPSVGNIVFWENTEPWLTVLYWPLPFCGQYCVLGEHWALTYSVILTPPLLWAILCSGRTLSLDLQCYTDPSPSVGNIVFWENTEPWLTVLYWPLPFCGQYCVLGEHWALTYSVILTPPLLWAILCSGGTLSLDLQCYTDPSPSVGNIVFWGNTEPWLTVLYWPLPFCGQYCGPHSDSCVFITLINH